MNSPDLAPPTLSNRRLAFVLGLACAVLYSGLTQGNFKGSDEAGVFQVTEALYQHQTLSISVHHHAHVGADGRLYHAWATGQSVLALPFYGLSQLAESTLPTSWTQAIAGPYKQAKRKLRAHRVEELRSAGLGIIRSQTLRYSGSLDIFFVALYAPIAGGVLVAVFFMLLRELGASTRASVAAALLTGLCSYPAMMSVYFLRHTTETIATVAAFALFHAYRRSGNLRLLAFGSFAASATFLVRFPAVLSVLGLAYYVGWCLRERVRTGERAAPALLATAGPLVLNVGIHCSLNYLKWGAWFASPMVSAGFEGSDSFWFAFSAFLWSPGISVFAYSPLLLLLPWTFPALWRKRRPECVAFVIIALTELLYFSNYRFWTGLWSSPGPRYLFPACVLLMVPLGLWLDGRRTRIQNGLLWGLASVGGLIQFALVTAKWSDVTRGGGYRNYDPPFSFMFVPGASPIVGSARAVLDGGIDTWLWKLGTGWTGHSGAPVVAGVLALVWIALCAILFLRVRRMTRDAS